MTRLLCGGIDRLDPGGTLSPAASEPFDVGVKDGRIVVFATPQSLDHEAARVIDARGKYVIPGGIEAHEHFNIGLSPAMTAQSETYGGRAAAFGGTTTFIDFALQRGGGSLVAAIEDEQSEINNDRPDVDYALHAITITSADLSLRKGACTPIRSASCAPGARCLRSSAARHPARPPRPAPAWSSASWDSLPEPARVR